MPPCRSSMLNANTRDRLRLGATQRRSTWRGIGCLVLLAAAMGFAACGSGDSRVHDFSPPATPPRLLVGELRYVAYCVRCHGVHAVGTDSGPSLLLDIYRAPHHADAAFELAVRGGVHAHHWHFGDMAALPQVGESDVREITAYVRWLQVQLAEIRR